MKTVRQHLNDLREPERTSALKAMEGSHWHHGYQNHPCLADALYVAFDWGKAFHGNAYWERIFDNLEAETYFDAPQLTPQVCKDKMVEHMATDEDYEKLEDVVKGIKATVYICGATPYTEPNFGTIFPKDDDERQKYPLAQTDLFFPDADAAFSAMCLKNQQKHCPESEGVTWAKDKSIGDGSQIRRHLLEFLVAIESEDWDTADKEIKSIDWRGRELHQRWIKKLPPFDNL